MKQSIIQAKQIKEEFDKEEINERIKQLKELIDKLYNEKKMLIEDSKKSYEKDERDKAKYLSDKAKDYQNRIDSLETYYSDLTFYSNNIYLINESNRIIDVRGLHADESIKRIAKRKRNIKGRGDLCIIVGTSNKSSISDLGMKIVNYLRDVEKCKSEINNPIKGRILVHYSTNNNKEDNEKEKNEIKSLIINSELTINKIKFNNSIVCLDDEEMKNILKEKELLIRKAIRQREEALLLQSKIDVIKRIENNEKNNSKQKNYKEEKMKLIEKINDLNKQASLNYFKGYNLLFIKRNENSTVDLHGQYVNEALAILEEKMKNLKGEKELKIIYGSGNHSIDHIQKLKPKILEFLNLNNVKYKEIDDASLVVYLCK